ncbi:hypothetical protein V8F20_008080 [Naviculisporaceae sp. PSN 640]
MDPISIAAGVGGLIDLCVKAGFAIKNIHEGSKSVDSKIALLDEQIRLYTHVLELMSSTIQDPMIAPSLQATGHIGSHWRSMLAFIEDSCDTLERLNTRLREVDKSARLMSSARKHLRLLFASDEIEAYQKTIKSYRDTMQMSIQIVILWNQVDDQPSQVNMAVRLDELTSLIRKLYQDTNAQMAELRTLVQESASKDRVQALSCMKRCIETAAEVVSSASTSLSIDERMSAGAYSPLQDVFESRNDEEVMRWMEESLQETMESISSSQNSSGSSFPDISGLSLHDTHPEDDMELELEFIRVHQKRVRYFLAKERWSEATRELERGIARLRKHGNRLKDPDLRTWFYGRLRNAYRREKSWERLKSICLDYMELNPPNSANYDNREYLITMWDIALVYARLGNTTKLKEYLKGAIEGFTKMGEDGESLLLRPLRLMISVCNDHGEATEVEAYQLMYDELRARMEKRAETERDQTGQESAEHMTEQPVTSKTESQIAGDSEELEAEIDKRADPESDKTDERSISDQATVPRRTSEADSKIPGDDRKREVEQIENGSPVINQIDDDHWASETDPNTAEDNKEARAQQKEDEEPGIGQTSEDQGISTTELVKSEDGKSSATEQKENGEHDIDQTAENQVTPSTRSKTEANGNQVIPSTESKTGYLEISSSPSFNCFINVHMVTSDSPNNPTYRGKIFRAIPTEDRVMGWWTDAAGKRMAPMPFQPSTIANITHDNTKLIMWEKQGHPRGFKTEDSSLFELPECTIHYYSHFTHTWKTSPIQLSPTTRMPLCILVALKVANYTGVYNQVYKVEYQFGGSYQTIHRYFYNPKYFSTPIILLGLIDGEVSEGVKSCDPEVRPSAPAPDWMPSDRGGGESKPTRGYYRFFRSREDYAGIREVLEFISGRSWEGKQFGPPKSQSQPLTSLANFTFTWRPNVTRE